MASPFGELTFFDGVPSTESIPAIYDMLDLNRAIEVYLTTLPGASLVAVRHGFRSVSLDGTRPSASSPPAPTRAPSS